MCEANSALLCRAEERPSIAHCQTQDSATCYDRAELTTSVAANPPTHSPLVMHKLQLELNIVREPLCNLPIDRDIVIETNGDCIRIHGDMLTTFIFIF